MFFRYHTLVGSTRDYHLGSQRFKLSGACDFCRKNIIEHDTHHFGVLLSLTTYFPSRK